jgi:hypothetical protein
VLALDEQLEGDGPPVLFDDAEDREVLVSLGRRRLEVFVKNVPMPDERDESIASPPRRTVAPAFHPARCVASQRSASATGTPFRSA